jgi:hypothetical protein
MDLSRAGHRIIVYKNRGHPETHLWIDIDDRQYFLGVLVPGMTRRDVRAMAERWLHERPQHLQAGVADHST